MAGKKGDMIKMGFRTSISEFTDAFLSHKNKGGMRLHTSFQPKP